MTWGDAASTLSAVAALAAVAVAFLNLKHIHSVHVSINSRMDQLLRATGITAKAEGRAEERADRHARQKIKEPDATVCKDG